MAVMQALGRVKDLKKILPSQMPTDGSLPFCTKGKQEAVLTDKITKEEWEDTVATTVDKTQINTNCNIVIGRDNP